jgi:hypothetical protein
MAFVHVTESNVDVMIDGESYRVESGYTPPIVCDLSPGPHTLRMSRQGRVLYEESFTLRPGDEAVLTAWDVSRTAAAGRAPSPVAGSATGPRGLVRRGGQVDPAL